MLLKRGCPPMSHIWGTKAQINNTVISKKKCQCNILCPLQSNHCTITALQRRVHKSTCRALVQYNIDFEWKHPSGHFCLLAYLYCHISFSDLPHVETDCGNHVFTELARLHGTNAKTNSGMLVNAAWYTVNRYIKPLFLKEVTVSAPLWRVWNRKSVFVSVLFHLIQKSHENVNHLCACGHNNTREIIGSQG